MLTVHHLENSRSQRLLWLLEELGLPYAVQRYTRDPQTMLAPPELRQVHPLGKSPLLGDGDVVIAETGAIFDYVIERYGNGRLQPVAGTLAHRRYRYWLHYAEGSLMPLLMMKLIFNRTTRAPTPWLVRPIAKAIARAVGDGFLDPNLKRHLDVIETELAATGWFAGDELSAADVMMSFPLQAAAARGGAGSGYPNIASFIARVEARPAYRAALDKGGPFALLS